MNASPKRAPAPTRKLVLIGTVIGLITMLAGAGVGIVAYRASRDAVIRTVYEENLNQAKTLATGLDSHLASMSSDEALAEMVLLWSQDHPPEITRNQYLCAVGPDGHIQAHTKNPGVIGENVGGLQVVPSVGITSIRDILLRKIDWVGEGTSLNGEKQLVAYAYAPQWGGIIGLHKPMAAVTAPVRAAARPWAIGLALVLGILVPTIITLMHLVYAAHRRETEQARLALAESEARYRSVTEDVFEHSMVAMLLSDNGGKIVWKNRAAEDLLERENGNRSKFTVRELLWRMQAQFSSSADAVSEILASYENNTHLRGVEWANEGPGGTLWLEYWSQPIQTGYFAAGRMEYLSDITQRKQNQEQLERSLSLSQATFEATEEGLLVTDLAQRIVQSNPQFLKIWRFPKDVFEGSNSDRREFVLNNVKNPMEFINRVSEIEQSDLATKFDEFDFVDGRKFEVATNPQTVDGHKIGRVWSFRDITERHGLEQRLRQSQKMEAVGNLAGGIAHDFNNLLTAIIGYGDSVLRRLPLGDRNRTEVDEIVKAGLQAAALTGQLLALSRKQVIRPDVFAINAIVEETKTLLRRLIESNVALEFKLADQAGNLVADKNQIQQVILNLALNARDAMPTGGTLLIETNCVELAHGPAHRWGLEPGKYTQLRVVDDGEGMDEATRARIFEPLYTTKDTGRGTGLGLSIVFGVVQAAHGHIEVDSEPGRGTCVSILFPLSDRKPELAQKRDAEPTQGSGTILVAEDEDVVRRLMDQVLTGAGYTVLSAASGEEAEALARDQSGIDLLLTDLMMPGMNGADLAERLRATHPLLKIVFVSGYAENEKNRLHASGQDAWFLQKPFNVGELLRLIQKALQSDPADHPEKIQGPV